MKIPLVVTCAHALILVAAIYIKPTPLKTTPRRPVAVITHTMPQERLQIADPTPIPESEPVASQRTVQPPPPPTPAPEPTLRPRPTPKATPTPPAVPPQRSLAQKPAPKTTSPHHEKLVSMVQNSLNTLNTQKGASQTTGVSKKIGPLASEALSFEAKYEEELVSYLEALLSFPEKGNVKVKLTLKREGCVQKLEILQASSPKNREYIIASLASCSFPAFGSHFKGETTHTFILNLTSERS